MLARNSCPRLPHSVDSRFGLYHVAVLLGFLCSPALQKFESVVNSVENTFCSQSRLPAADLRIYMYQKRSLCWSLLFPICLFVLEFQDQIRLQQARDFNADPKWCLPFDILHPIIPINFLVFISFLSKLSWPD